MKHHFVWIFAGLMFIGTLSIAQSKVITDEMVSQSLEGNLLNDPSTRPMNIYLPPSYDVGSRHYPVIYFLHGYTANQTGWLNYGIDSVMDDLIQQAEMQEMIIVMPNAHNRYNGSWYANSSVAGNYEDYITQDLVEFIDGQYRTLPYRGSRAIAGGSMGGHGAMKLAIKHPEVYSVVVSHSGVLSLNRWKGVPASIDPAFPAMAIAFSPNPANPLLYDYPAGNGGKVQEEIWQRWLEHDPVTLAKTHATNLERLAGIYFDHGTSDTVVSVSHARDFDRALTEVGIPHVYQEHNGGHTDKFPSQLRISLPFISGLLSANEVTAVSPQGKLATTWATIKHGQ